MTSIMQSARSRHRAWSPSTLVATGSALAGMRITRYPAQFKNPKPSLSSPVGVGSGIPSPYRY